MRVAIERNGRRADRDRAIRRRLRAGVLRLGGYLGWDRRRVVRFSEAVVGLPWRRCGRAELLQVLGAFAEVAARVRTANQTSGVDGSAEVLASTRPTVPGPW